MKNDEVEKVFVSRMAVKTETANEYGISNERLRLLEKQGEIEKVDYGLYVHKDTPIDLLYIYQQRRRVIYSHETALYLHDLTDRDPLNYSGTVTKGYNSKKLKELGFDIYYTKKEWYSVGVVKVKTSFGNDVRVYSMERTLCDLLKSKHRLEKSLIIEAFQTYIKRSDKNLHDLMKMAKLFKVENKVRTYMEMLM